MLPADSIKTIVLTVKTDFESIDRDVVRIERVEKEKRRKKKRSMDRLESQTFELQSIWQDARVTETGCR